MIKILSLGYRPSFAGSNLCCGTNGVYVGIWAQYLTHLITQYFDVRLPHPCSVETQVHADCRFEMGKL
jgi:hypothetical protein